MQIVPQEGEADDTAAGVCDDAVPFANWRIAQPAEIVPPARPISRVVERDQRSSVRGKRRGRRCRRGRSGRRRRGSRGRSDRGGGRSGWRRSGRERSGRRRRSCQLRGCRSGWRGGGRRAAAEQDEAEDCRQPVSQQWEPRQSAPEGHGLFSGGEVVREAVRRAALNSSPRNLPSPYGGGAAGVSLVRQTTQRRYSSTPPGVEPEGGRREWRRCVCLGGRTRS